MTTEIHLDDTTTTTTVASAPSRRLRAGIAGLALAAGVLLVPAVASATTPPHVDTFELGIPGGDPDPDPQPEEECHPFLASCEKAPGVGDGGDDDCHPLLASCDLAPGGGGGGDDEEPPVEEPPAGDPDAEVSGAAEAPVDAPVHAVPTFTG